MFSDFSFFRKSSTSSPARHHHQPMVPTPPSSPPDPSSSGPSANHVDIDALLEDYAWRRFRELLTIKGSGLDAFKALDVTDVEFDIVRLVDA